MSKRLFIKTFGCQMNEHDSEKISGILATLDYLPTDRPENADIVILNTCAIREKAEQKCFSDLGRIRKLKQENPDLIIGVGGCVAQLEGKKILSRAPYVDLVFGTDNIHEIPKLIQERRSASVGAISIQRHKKRQDTPPRRDHSVKAWVTVVDGCDKFCTFCVVPHTRGRERSRSPEKIKREVEALAAEGFREVTLLGQNVNAYGKDLPYEIDLADLLREIQDVPGIERIRFVTSHPSAFHEKLARAMAELPKVCEALHLPLQSGSDRVLQRMKRDYTWKEYREKITLLRTYMPEIVLTTDVIVGFPGETQDDFDRTLQAIREIEYDNLYAFKYSPRPHTVASSMEDTIPEETKESRLEQVLSLQRDITLRKNKEMVGQSEEVLIEGVDRKGRGRLTGRTRGNKLVHLEEDTSKEWLGRLVTARITRATDSSLRGEVSY